MAVNWLGLVSMGVFYLVILGTGIWASRKSKREEKKCNGNRSEVAMVGGRNLNIWVSIFTMTATFVGGGYILSSAEVTYDPTQGLVWAIGPLGFFLNLVLGALFFVKPVRAKKYVTLMDFFQEKYSNTVTAILFIPCLLADIFWVACVLSGLGGTVSVILDISSHVAVTISAAVAVLYTLMGGLYSVAYTDVIQLGFIFIGLWLCVPFILSSPSSANITFTAVTELYQEPWIGKLELADTGHWIDDLLLLSLGGVCYQAFYQRVFATPTDAQAQITCYVAAVFCLILAVPSLLIGAVAASTDWNQTTFGLSSPYEEGKAGMILPIALQHLCPPFISLVGIGALTAAVMSSVDSALLSAASQIARNIYKNIIHKRASEETVLVVVKVSVLLVGLTGAGLAMTTTSVYVFWILSGDIMYSVMFPQVASVLFLNQQVNQYGACTGLVVGLLLRILVGESSIGLPAVLPLPGDQIHEDGHTLRLFPFRTAIMLITLGTVLLVSRLAVCMAERGLLSHNVHRLVLCNIPGSVHKDMDENDELNKEQLHLPSQGNVEVS